MKNTRTEQLCYVNFKNGSVYLLCVQTHTTFTHKNVKAVEQALSSLLRHSFITKSA